MGTSSTDWAYLPEDGDRGQSPKLSKNRTTDDAQKANNCQQILDLVQEKDLKYVVFRFNILSINFLNILSLRNIYYKLLIVKLLICRLDACYREYLFHSCQQITILSI
jgi:hypothetical protein